MGGAGLGGGSGPFGEGSGGPNPVAVENFHMLRERQTADNPVDPEDKHQRVNLLNWDGKGAPAGLFPKRREKDRKEPGGANPPADSGDAETEPRP